MRHRRGTVLLVVILTAFYLIAYGRAVLRQGGPPAFYVEEGAGVTVLLEDGFPSCGVHQFSDGSTPRSVIEMTGLFLAPKLVAGREVLRPLLPGEALSIVRSGAQVVEMKRDWMQAGQRMALGIALHPDRMDEEDWQTLSGIGPKLARRIEKDRQDNGDFGSLEAVQRVRGIGPRRIAAWKKYF